ncbi:phage tail protein [Cellulomonas wangsupingiae]|uniref:Phage tail protein n=1 Tax=Cellulomonas wangsupingiae TaxID=2968085 RepID=A0ABY5K3V6_9CELL|nr:phage tail protein [Cellulomonas wangsupingiae]MCC2336472.1 phage tail protein [Cellulomonas wangsupingiae]MCM0640838.1 phage tail protein [Cellulomonas wangsupingiae]UUI64650.1 phage tail protein [Cellulomonas wangsupingiae]
MASNGLFSADPIISQNFFLELDGKVVSALVSVSGLDVEVGVGKVTQIGKDGKKQQVKFLGQTVEVPDLQLSRVAPANIANDELWKWFKAVREGGLSGDRAKNRKNGSVVLYDAGATEVARFNFFNGWPSKISTDQLSVDGSDAIKETVSIVIERLERVK